jgi:anti-sigma factor RsiW
VSAHLTPTVLNSLVDGELSPEQLASAQQHLETCSACTSMALGHALLKAAVAKSGHRYSLSPDFAGRLKQIVANDPGVNAPGSTNVPQRPSRWTPALAFAGWALAALLLLAGIVIVQRGLPYSGSAVANNATLAEEICDIHVAALADSSPAQVISTDRHTVKPWFQGKIPFTFNLPDQLPADIKLDGANLTYIEGRPAAQLFYSIGHHRVSVFLQQRIGGNITTALPQVRSGFHLATFSTDELDAVAISDVDPARLAALSAIIEQAQPTARK